MPIPSIYSPTEVEQRWYSIWESSGHFKPDPNASKKPFTIVIPPPNVTGILHMGHALNNTLQDILIRQKRMQGFAALWVPGTDHAGIATQNVVERQLAKERLTRQKLGREEFIKRVWAWREQYGFRIVKQLRRLGFSCDWSRERFTMDDRLSKAVETAFLKLHEAGLIYRSYYLVNWCPRCQTALSDEEVQHEEIKGHLYYIRYPWDPSFPTSGRVSRIPDEFKGGVVVATTRPETLLGDVAVAVHPEDPRYHFVLEGRLSLPILRRPLPIIWDEAVDREFGTGAVKVTPAHDPVDFRLGQKHGLEAIRVMHSDGRMNEQAGPYRGLDRFECRKRILKDLTAQGLLVKTEEHTTPIGHCYRCKTIVEPTLSPQWFVKMEPLAKLGIEAVEKDGLRFIPERWTKVYLDWLKNIRDWCISRQIWWGHRIPVWYCPTCYPKHLETLEKGTLNTALVIDPEFAGIHVGPKEPLQCRHCGAGGLVQDPDVLDTWFSSWLWPFSTLGWPEKTKDLATFYPTSVLVTGQDILFFWVARMVMAGKFFMGKIPFKDVAIHGIIRVEGGKKMSKSLGNIIDPLEVIDRMGADALRFSIAHMTSEGQDLYLSEAKFLLGRNFANKLWNAARLILEAEESVHPEPVEGRTVMVRQAHHDRSDLTVPDRWVLSRLQQVIEKVTAALEDFHFNGAAKLLYQFIWHDFCDWYLEITKLQRESGEATVVQNTNQILRMVLEIGLRLLHPFMPFITEELWQKVQRTASIDPVRPESFDSVRPELVEGRSTIMRASWPQPTQARIDPEAEEAFARLQAVITEVRNIRATFRVPIREKVALLVQAEKGTDLLTGHEKVIQRLGGVDSIRISPRVQRPEGSVVSHLPSQGDFGAWDLVVPLSGLVDLGLERKRIQKEVEALESRAQAKRTRLNDLPFRSRAPADVIAEEEESLKDLEAQLSKWTESLKGIEG